MASVFLSYDRDDADKARFIAGALEKAGHSVWWDLHVRGGAQFGKVIEEALKAAQAVVVLWSKQSIESAWVRDEAAVGRDTGRLVPITIDGTEPPLGFRQFQTIDLSRWKGRGKSKQLQTLLDDVNATAASNDPVPSADERPATSARSHHVRPSTWALGRPVVAAIGLVVIIAASLLAWRLVGWRSSIPVVAVAAADSSPGSQALSRDLLVKLGTLQAAQPGSIDLLSQDDATKKPGLIFQVGRSDRDGAEANLALTDASDRALLWAKNFRDPNGNEADLRQQLAYTAANVLRCAVEGMDPAGGRLNRQALKTYLNACAPNPNASQADIVTSIADLRKLVRDEPRFAGGWAKLLSAETDVAADPIAPEAKSIQSVLPRHIAEARKLHPDLAEAYVAEEALTPPWRFVARGKLLDEGVERNPNSPKLRFARHVFNSNVGRVEDSLRDARRAVELDPLSPDMRYGYIMSLAFGGRQDEAIAELTQAERLWPGATSLRIARYDLHNRTGDPHEALRLLRAGVLGDALTEWVRPQASLLEARIDPTPERVETAIRDTRAMYNRTPNAISLLAQALVELDREEELFPILLNWKKMDIVSWVTEILFRPKFSDFHKDPRFMRVAKRLGLLAYWRTTGKWPDLCFRPDLPYDCKAEAAKLG